MYDAREYQNDMIIEKALRIAPGHCKEMRCELGLHDGSACCEEKPEGCEPDMCSKREITVQADDIDYIQELITSAIEKMPVVDEFTPLFDVEINLALISRKLKEIVA
jgi:hypothetical protein